MDRPHNEEEDGSTIGGGGDSIINHDDDDDNSKKAKTTATTASSSSSIPTTSSQPNTLPPQHHHHHHLLRLHSLPDIAHDAIASYLINRDIHRMMECDQWLLKAYGGRIERLVIPSGEGDNPSRLALTMISLLGRRPGLSEVTVSMDKRLKLLVVAIRRGYLNKLQSLKMDEVDLSLEQKTVCAGIFCTALAEGFCPKINALEVVLRGNQHGPFMSSLTSALRSRMEEGKGCCGLKSIKILGSKGMDLAILSSGACEAVEELQVGGVSLTDQSAIDLSEWLLRTKASNLRILKLPHVPPDVVATLCSGDVAPGLQTLHIPMDNASSLSLLSEGIGYGAWPDLLDTRIEVHEGRNPAENQAMKRAVPGLVEAIGVGALNLKVLSSCYSDRMFGPEGGAALAKMLGDGGCPQLEELDLSDSNVDDGVMVELARALEGGFPCNTTLRRLDLSDNQSIGGAGVRALMEAIEGGALPHLDYLNLSGNEAMKDHGVVALAMAMTKGRRSLSCLGVLDLRGVGMTELGAWTLFEAFRYHKPCPHLKTLRIGGNHEIGNGGMMQLAKAIEVGALQDLNDLDIRCVGMRSEGFRALIKAMVAQQPTPGCPRLKVLDVANNNLRDEGVVCLAEAIKLPGAMQHLREIGLEKTGVGDVGAVALLDALIQRHVCPNLESLNMFENNLGVIHSGRYSTFSRVSDLLEAVKAIRGHVDIFLE